MIFQYVFGVEISEIDSKLLAGWFILETQTFSVKFEFQNSNLPKKKSKNTQRTLIVHIEAFLLLILLAAL